MKRKPLSPRFEYVVLILSQLGIFCGIGVLRSAKLLFQTTEVFYWKVFYQRGLPLVLIACAAALFGMIRVILCHRAAFRVSFRGLPFGFVLIVFLLAGVFGIVIGKTRIGLEKENSFYGKPTVPLLEWHMIAGFLICAFWTFVCAFGKEDISAKVSRFFPLVIWSFAFGCWIAIPNQYGFFSPAGRAPNFETYPFSDGSFYGHYARALAEGMGFKGNDIPPRPLYIAILSLLHKIAGNDYDTIIFLQTLILAFFPVFVYWIGKELHSDSAGLCAAAFVILRETHSILVAPFGHNVSCTKYFFADLPAAFACSVFILMMIRWMKAIRAEEPRLWVRAMLAGCALGVMTLIRTQSLCLAFMLLFVPFVKKGKGRKRVCELLCFAGALALTVAPWLIRNDKITGKFVFDHPFTQTAEMARSYNFDNEDLTQLPGENDGEYSERLTAFISGAFKKHFPKIARIITIHFVNNEISNLRLFPLRGELSDPQALLRTEKPFWETLDNGDLTPYDLVFLGLSLLMLLYGIAAASRDKASEGFLPFAAITVFNLSTAVGRYSAGRYLIPPDWILLVYAAIAFAEICRVSAVTVGSPVTEESHSRLPRPIEAFLFILLSAAVIPFAEHLTPNRFEQMPESEVRETVGELEMMCSEENSFYFKTIALYPRYYAAFEGEPESAKQGFDPSTPYGRLVFLSLAPGYFGTIELRTETLPEVFPDGAEILLNACQSGATSIAETIRYTDENGKVYTYRAE